MTEDSFAQNAAVVSEPVEDHAFGPAAASAVGSLHHASAVLVQGLRSN